MTDLLLNIITLSVSVSVLVLTLLLLSHFFGKKVTAKCRYVIWAIVIVRLCLPIGLAPERALISFEIPQTAQTQAESPEVKPSTPADTGAAPANDTPTAVTPDGNTSVGTNPTVSDTPTVGKTPTINDTPAIAPTINDTPAVAPTANDTPAVAPTASDTPANDADASFRLPPTQTILSVASYVWLVGAVIFAGIRLSVHFAETSSYKRGRRLCDDGTYTLYGILCEEYGITDAPKLYVCDAVDSPLLYGVFKPCILLPAYELTDARLTS